MVCPSVTASCKVVQFFRAVGLFRPSYTVFRQLIFPIPPFPAAAYLLLSIQSEDPHNRPQKFLHPVLCCPLPDDKYNFKGA